MKVIDRPIFVLAVWISVTWVEGCLTDLTPRSRRPRRRARAGWPKVPALLPATDALQLRAHGPDPDSVADSRPRRLSLGYRTLGARCPGAADSRSARYAHNQR